MTHAASRLAARTAPPRASWFNTFRARLKRWRERSETRSHLEELEPHRLADIGLTEGQRRRECARWFWQ